MERVTPLVSYIVPVYNAERYLRKTLDALSAQTYKNVEFILVNDGSTDKSAAICDEYCQKDSRFTCIHTANGGVSRARNAGIAKASGEYLMFCDADDIPHANIVESLTEKCDGADIVLCGFCRVCGKKRTDSVFSEERVHEQKNDIIKNLVMPMCVWGYSPDGECVSEVYGSVWRGLYARKLFDSVDKPFDVDLQLGEDMLLNAKLFMRADSVRVVPSVLYDYYENPTSATHTNFDKLWSKYLKLWKKTRDFLTEVVSEDDMKWYSFQLTRYAVGAVTEGICTSDMSENEKTEAVRRILSVDEVKEAVRVVPKGLGVKDKILLKLLRPHFAAAVCKYYGKRR